MEVGKKYNNGTHTYTCVLLTPAGNAIIKNDKGAERLTLSNYFYLYREVKEPVVQYVHWYRDETTKTNNKIWCYANGSITPAKYQFHTFLKTDKVTCGD